MKTTVEDKRYLQRQRRLAFEKINAQWHTPKLEKKVQLVHTPQQT
jgi:hypothetical protein